jgi:hypothetical protein
MLDWILYIPAVLAGLSFAYVNICIVALLLFRARINAKQDWSHRPPITVLYVRSAARITINFR